MTDARSIALHALQRVEHGAYANLALPELLRDSGLDARDRAFATDLVYGTVRKRRALDHLLAPRSSQPLLKLESRVLAALRIGAYQLVEGVPAHAAVSETVAAVQPRARGYVNGVLRAVARAGPPWPWPAGDGVEALGVRYSQPDWIVELLVSQFGSETAVAVLETSDTPPAVTLRVNPMRATPADVARPLRDAGARVEAGRLLPDALVVTGVGDVGALDAVRNGRATPQDEASQAVAQLVARELRDGARVLDVAAAPGGKSTAIAEWTRDHVLVVAADLHRARVGRIKEAAQRLRLGSVAPLAADGRALPVPAEAFDAVLVDAPCSGLGALRRRPDARWRIQPADVETLAAIQRDLLASAIAAVAPGGRLVYAVCTYAAAETLGVDEWLAATHPELAPLPPPGSPWRAHGRGALLLPSDAGTDGMFVLHLRRS
ncbi:MAG TPA: 16S rRNA (cytosine(967)-C(5))-methyltransferase RsmB [Acidimicrobiia bacterium]|jgi:16S rRNA (cytosine967-C5)-methyltransferase|nr:16S rRNA (cytosine(967)-C(5))-methyltransferase RsmB [Acidimicrobiia bacterium]